MESIENRIAIVEENAAYTRALLDALKKRVEVLALLVERHIAGTE